MPTGLITASCCTPISAITVSLVSLSWLLTTYSRKRFFLQVMQFQALFLFPTHTSKPGCGYSGEEDSPHGKACIKKEMIDYQAP